MVRDNDKSNKNLHSAEFKPKKETNASLDHNLTSEIQKLDEKSDDVIMNNPCTNAERFEISKVINTIAKLFFRIISFW